MKDHIRMARISKGLSQDTVAQALGITRVALSKIENGNVRIVNIHVSALADLLGISLEELLLGYVPERDASERLFEKDVEYDEKYRRLQHEYEGELTHLRDLVESQKMTIHSQEEIIKMLKRRIPEENA